MDLATKPIAQLTELFKSMTPAARVTAGLLLVVTVVSIAYLFNHPMAGAHVMLMDGQVFSTSQLRDMQAAFGKAGLEAELDGARLRIPRGQESKYMAALDEADALPVDYGHNMQQAVNTNGFLRIGQRQQEAARRVAKQKDLQRLIEEMRGIDRAAVLIDEEETEHFPRPKRRLTSAVTVFPADDHPLDLETVRTIRQLMVGSVSGLEPQAVTVVDMSENRSFVGDDESGQAGGDYAAAKKRLELEWKQSIADVLAYIPDVLVSTNVELERETADAENQRQARAKRVTASVAVPSTYYEALWRKEHPRSAGQPITKPEPAALAKVETRETQNIERLVANLLPHNAAAGTAKRQVAVTTFHPLLQQSSARQVLRENARAWLFEHWRTLTLGGLALIGLLVLRWMFRSIGGARRQPAGSHVELPPTISLSGDAVAQPASTISPPHFERAAVGRSSLNRELANAVRDDPDAAVSVLRTWIGNGS
jgi:flagellar biosynthesis/type III secretory pathway M-ring protein FliF/YscJ